MILLGFALAYIGFVALSLAMRHHYLPLRAGTERGSKSLSSRQVVGLRFIGTVFLAASCTFCVASQGIANGVVFWVGLLTIAALAQSVLLTYRPQWIAGSALLLVSLGMTGMALS
ncbi:MAG: DUF3325 domain-containing protein [Immundisolibacteraceae bacterium]|nr:DUF3325 domain-containing protein [Immundisolibacteraceae bacterium]